MIRVITMQLKNQDNICGGAYRKYMDLIDAMLSEGWEVHHISPKGFSNIKHYNLYHYGVVDMPIYPSCIPFSVQALYKMFKIHNKNKIDAIIVFSPLECLIASIFKIFVSNVRIILSFHADSIAGAYIGLKDGIKKYIYIKLLEKIERRAIKRADLITFVSEYDKNNIIRRNNCEHLEKNIHIIYNNVNTKRTMKLSQEPAIDLDNKVFKIGFVGNLYGEGKGIKYLIRAFYNVKRAVKECKLIIVGTGPDELKLKKLCSSLNLQCDVIFIGWVENPLQYMKGFDLMILPSLHEACPLVILESLYVGTPVIASRVGGIPEMLKYDELLLEPANIKVLTEKIINIINNKSEYDKIVDLCKERVKIFEFNWAQLIIGVITEALNA